MHTGPLVITTGTPRLWLNPMWDWCIYVYMTAVIDLPSLHPLRPLDTHSHIQPWSRDCLHPLRPLGTHSHIHTTPSPRPRSSRSHALRYFGFLRVRPDLQFRTEWPLGLGLLYVYPCNPVNARRFRSSCFSVWSLIIPTPIYIYLYRSFGCQKGPRLGGWPTRWPFSHNTQSEDSYRTDYNNNPRTVVSLMTAVDSTVRLGGYIVNLCDFYSYRIIGKLTVFL
jgi:hypothetical protein